MMVARGVLAVLLVVAGPPVAAASAATWRATARKVNFPVYEPTRTLGLTSSGPAIYPCEAPPLPRSLVGATYTGAHGAFFSVREMYPGACGNGDEAKRVARPKIHGVTASLFVNCRGPCHVTARDGFKDGFQLYWRERGARRTWMEMFARHVRPVRIDCTCRWRSTGGVDAPHREWRRLAPHVRVGLVGEGHFHVRIDDAQSSRVGPLPTSGGTSFV
jgi:hypothetical protein